MIVLHTVTRQRLKRSAKKVCSVFFETLHNNYSCSRKRSIVNIAPLYTSERYCPLSRSTRLLLDGYVVCSPSYLQHRRFNSTDSRDNPPLPSLTDMPVQVQPAFMGGLKFLLISTFKIRPQLDQDFSLNSFLKTSDQVVQVVSNRLAELDYDALEEMFTSDVFAQIKRNLPHFTESQRQELALKIEDIVMSFIHDIQIIENPNQVETRLQITTVHHILKGAEELRKAFENFNLFQMMTPLAVQGDASRSNPIEELRQGKHQLRGFVANFKFSRTYNTENGLAGDWIISGLNYRGRETPLLE